MLQLDQMKTAAGRAPVRGPHKECSRCGKHLRDTALKKATHCSNCGRWYHKNCFMAETGAQLRAVAATSDRCVCCLSRLTDNLTKTRSRALNKYARAFLKDGFCVVPLASKSSDSESIRDELSAWNGEVLRYFSAMLQTYECQAEMGHALPTLESGFANFRQRCPGRFEIIADFITSKVVPLVTNAESVQETLNALLSNAELGVGKKVMSSGCFLSLIGSETQNAHTDGPALSEIVNLFPYAVNVFVPLTDVDSHNGTEFFPGSHLVGHSKRDKSVSPSVAVGNVLLFDYRVVHRGLRNAKIDPRPCYYVTFAQSWYQDTYNFSARRYKRRLEVNPAFLESREERMAKKRRAEESSITPP